jgi:hypothetical protein
MLNVNTNVNTNTMGERMRYAHAGGLVRATLTFAALTGTLVLGGATVAVSRRQPGF